MILLPKTLHIPRILHYRQLRQLFGSQAGETKLFGNGAKDEV